MEPSCLEHRLTDSERTQFDTQGYFVVPGALPPERVAALTAKTDEIHAARIAAGFDPHGALFYPDFIPDSPLFQELVDEPGIFPKVWGILGWNIYLYHAHLIVTPPTNKLVTDATYGWHQDSGRVNAEIECHPRPRLSLKVAYFLSDVSEPGRGNFWVLPGSHRDDTLALPPDRKGQPEGAIPVCVKPGDVVFFDRRLWHTASPNGSEVTRKVLFYGYGYRWLRTKDDMTVRDLWEGCDPIRRQLLGWGVNANGFYTPSDDDVPLRTWLREHAPEDAR